MASSAEELEAWFDLAIWRVGRGVQVLGTKEPGKAHDDRYADVLRYVIRSVDATLRELDSRWLTRPSALDHGAPVANDSSAPAPTLSGPLQRSSDTSVPRVQPQDAANHRVKDVLTDRVLAIGDACGFSSQSNWDVVQVACSMYEKMTRAISAPNPQRDSFRGGLNEAFDAIENFLPREGHAPPGFRFDQKRRGRPDADDNRPTVSELLCFLTLLLAFAGTMALIWALDWTEPVAQNVLSEAIIGLAVGASGVGLRVILNQWDVQVPWLRAEEPRQGVVRLLN